MIANLTAQNALAIPSFPGAEGWGGDTVGGRGNGTETPKVYVVSNLNTSGPGSFNEAFRASGPRFIVFSVSGVIDLLPQTPWYYISGANSFVTVAGQTSPGGITLQSGSGGSSILLSYKGGFHEAVFRFVRWRAGAHNEDALTFSGVKNFIIDHCDFSGGSDETLDLSSNSDFTVQWNTIANSSAGQTYGFLMANYSDGHHISVHHNLIANHVNRFPEMHWNNNASITDNARIDYRNNVAYNGQNYFFISQRWTAPVQSVHINFVGNTFKAGPNSPPNNEPAGWFWNMNSFDEHFLAYEADNVMISRFDEVRRDRVAERFAHKTPVPVTVPAVTTQGADAAYGLVLEKTGAWPRDAMNLRTINEVRTKTGQLREDDDCLLWNNPSGSDPACPVSGTPPAAPSDADNDGMADDWELAVGLNPGSAADNVQDTDNAALNADGSLNIEEYINDLALARLCDPVKNAAGASAIQAILSSWGYTPPCGATLPGIAVPARPRRLRVR